MQQTIKNEKEVFSSEEDTLEKNERIHLKLLKQWRKGNMEVRHNTEVVGIR